VGEKEKRQSVVVVSSLVGWRSTLNKGAKK
jgi:hypothetical protein